MEESFFEYLGALKLQFYQQQSLLPTLDGDFLII